MDTKTFRVALVGCGTIAPNHVKGILSAGQTLVAVCDIDRSHAENLLQKFSLDLPIYTDYERMLNLEKPDAVHICTPHYLHAPMIVSALKKNINVLCEKPLGISIADLESIKKAEMGSTAMLGVCLQNRYEPNFAKLREIAKSDGVKSAYGAVVWKRDADYYASGAWRGKYATEGGGVMINQALHTLDLLQFCCGMPASVTAHISNDHLQGVIEVEDTATALFRLPDGNCFNLFATTSASGDFPAQLHLITKSGHRYFADNESLTCDGEVMAGEKSATSGKRVWGNGHAKLIADFYRHIANGEKFPIDATEGAKVIELILAMYESGKTNQTVHL